MQVIYLAFKENKKIQDDIWEIVKKNNSDKFSDIEFIKKKFYDFDYFKMMEK